MADQESRQKDEAKAAEEQQKAEAEALAADPIGGKPQIDIAQERWDEHLDAEPPGYVDPKAQEQPEGYAPDPKDVENPPVKEPKQSKESKKSKSGVTRDSTS